MAGDNKELETQVTDLEKTVEELLEELRETTKNQPDLAEALDLQSQLDQFANKSAALSDALEKATAANEEAQSEIRFLKTLSSLTDVEREFHKAWYDELEDKKEKEKKNGKKELPPEFIEQQEKMGKWLAMEPEQRRQFAAKGLTEKRAGDETVVIEGRTIRKSAVGEDVFTVMKAQAARIEQSEKDIAKAREDAEISQLRKRADDEYPHVPGSTEERASMLRAIGKMDEPLRKSFEALLEQSEKLAKSGFDKIGHKAGKDASPDLKKAAADFEGRVSAIRKRDNCNRQTAMAAARKENPDLFKAYQEVEQSN